MLKYFLFIFSLTNCATNNGENAVKYKANLTMLGIAVDILAKTHPNVYNIRYKQFCLLSDNKTNNINN